MARRYFGTDGIRGRVGAEPMTVDFALRLASAAARVLAKPRAERERLLAIETAELQADIVERERKQANSEAESAEEARRQALADAQTARSKIERDLAQLRAAIEAVRAEQIRLRTSIAERRRAAKLIDDDLARLVADIEARAASVAPGSEEADALLAEMVRRGFRSPYRTLRDIPR